MKQVNAEAADWLVRMRAPDFSAEDERRLGTWLAADARRGAALKRAESLLTLAPGAFAALDRAPVRPSRRLAWLPAGIAVAASLALFILFDGPMRLEADLMAGHAISPVSALEDGSLVQLNAGSAIALSFDGRQRKVHLLRGEAYFTVAKDAARPFVVAAAGGTVTALGTQFDVRLMEEAAGAEVTVLEHAVRIAAGSGAHAILHAGERLRYDQAGTLSAGPAVDTAAPDWRLGKLVVEDESLETVIARLQRHTGTQILILGDALKARRIGGTFDTADPIATIEMLCRSLGIEVSGIEVSGIGSLLLVLHG